MKHLGYSQRIESKMKFPDYYGRNMNAWIDCIDELTEKPTLLQIENGMHLKGNSPELFNTILECGAFVNFRKLEAGEKPI